MRILQICKKAPWPLTDGESIAVNALSLVYSAEGHEVDLLYMNTAKHFRSEQEVRSGLTQYHNISFCHVDNTSSPLAIIKNLISHEPYHVSRIFSKVFDTLLKNILNKSKYDIIQLESVYLMTYIDTLRSKTQAKIVLRAHNVEHIIWQRQAALRGSYLKKWYLNKQSQRIKQFELRNLKKVDLVIPISKIDQLSFRQMGITAPMHVAFIGLDISAYTYTYRDKSTNNRLRLCFIGSLDWMPNVSGVQWFLRQVWPLVKSEYRQRIEFHLAGRQASPRFIKQLPKDINYHGEVPDAQAFILRYDVLIVPLWSGSGLRVKIIEAMAAGIPVLSTALGLEGISAKHGQEVYIADDTASWIHSLRQILDGDMDIQSVSHHARQFAELHFDAQIIGREVIQVFERMLA